MITPNPLRKGDTIAIISTARKISMEELRPAIDRFESWGLQVVTGPHLFDEHNQFAGDDNARLEDLQWAIEQDTLKAVVCARGGYGTTKFVDHADFAPLGDKPKWFCGFSDVTALIGSINNAGVEALHSTMPIFFDGKTSEASIESLRKALFGEKLEYECRHHSFNKTGKVKGVITGGNLSMLNNLIATRSDVDMNGKILFMEDLDEYLYHVDRMMVHLDRAGKLENLAGLIVGSMSDMNDNAKPFGMTAEEIINEHCSKYDYPMCFGFPVGHEKENFTMICGREATLDITKESTKLVFKQV